MAGIQNSCRLEKEGLTLMANESAQSHPRRHNRLLMFAVLMIFLAVVGLLVVALRRAEIKAASEHKHTFVEYVAAHHLGRLVLIDDGTGLDPSFYMLELYHPVPDAQEESEAIFLMKYYVQNDNGQAMSIVYTDPKTGKRRPMAEINFDDDEHLLNLTLINQEGVSRKIVRHENW